jgi:non-ribosomal peptide synthetase component F
MHKHTPGNYISIGKPTPNNSVYILDQWLKPVQIGERGAIWAGGRGVSRGYLGLPELTSQRYVYDKFADDGLVYFNPCYDMDN